ncbi:MAG: amidohydrolase family protein [Oligoflexia bacterium]|nr:amidohydrolase family protein [Oligoflexia bacterium]
MASLVIDFHTHVFPDTAQKFLPVSNELRKTVRAWLRPALENLHESGTLIRHLPDPLRRGLDEVSAVAPVSGLLLESTTDDLLETMDVNEVDVALVIPHPPTVSNDFVLEVCARDERLLPVAYVPKDAPKPVATLKALVGRGARALKIHPAADGEGPDSARYKKLLKAATEQGLPVILHTGCMHSSLLFKDSSLSEASLYAPWFKEFPKTPFVLAHMNWHAPGVAMNLAIEYPNVYVDTSWQPSEVIGEAVRRMGPERILFGSDWPLVGNNIAIGLERIRECVRMGLMSDEDADLILGENARKLLRIEGK